MPNRTPDLVLASTSVYRRALLARLGLPFRVVAPEVDEAARTGETPAALALRLAMEKALAVASRFPDAHVVGSDQVAEVDGEALGKPGDAEGCRTQLRSMQGRSVCFHTAVAVVRNAAPRFQDVALVEVTVRFRSLSSAEIDRYVDLEKPFDCAGSAKVEALGIVLLESVASDDPTALVGLPLIATSRLLRAAGIDPLASSGDLP